ncbi:hypothetical protein IH980_02055 [Patescibacteria group bacterium]|nr:hypothetical protein [Patescibacteria group bacterium]
MTKTVKDTTQEPDDVASEEAESLLTPAEEGERSVSGSAPATTSDDDVGQMVKDVIGNEPVPGKPFSIADEVEKDARAMHDIPPDEAKVEETETEEE